MTFSLLMVACLKMNNKYVSSSCKSTYIFTLLLLLTFPQKGEFQGGFIISKVFHDADEWVVQEKSLDRQLSGQLLNPPGKLTEFGTELGNYVHKEGLEGLNGVCVKLNRNGSWEHIPCPGPRFARLIDSPGNIRSH